MLPGLFTILRSARAIDLWNVAEALHMSKGMRRHSKRPNSQAKAVSCRSALRTGICQKRPGQIDTGLDLGFPQPG